VITGRRRGDAPAPDLPANIPLLLRARAAGPHGATVAFRLIDRFAETIDSVTYAQLWSRAVGVAGNLADSGVRPGEAVLLLMESSLSFYDGLFGSMLRGALPVAVYPPAGPQSLVPALDHLRKVLAQLPSARAILTSQTLYGVADQVRKGRPVGVRVLDRSVVPTPAKAIDLPGEKVGPDDPVLLQYTSGSLGDPRAIELSTRSIFGNLIGIGDAFGMRPGDIGLSWLPLYHDMGLHSAFFNLMFEMPLVLMSPLDFIRRPQAWLQAVSRYHVTHSPSPSFGYAYAARRIRDDDLQGVDLSTWRVAMCGAEPIDAAALFKFSDRFERHGFSKRAFMGAYGLAENTVAVSFGWPQSGLRVEELDAERLHTTGETVAPTGERHVSVTSVGVPLDGCSVRIVNAQERESPEGTQGEIQARGPGRMLGYLANTAATRDAFDGDWLRTGDLGFVRNGELFVTGRSKDLIIRAGKNYYPQDLENAAARVDGIRAGSVAAFGCRDPIKGTEEVVLVAEVKQPNLVSDAPLSDRVRKAVIDATGLTLSEVKLVLPGVVPKTTSGKVRRSECRSRYEAGSLTLPPRPGLALLARLGIWNALPSGIQRGWERIVKAIRAPVR
jgi:acyl-CoA synthetase (AMP-forming)/AMP-acid ligase II